MADTCFVNHHIMIVEIIKNIGRTHYYYYSTGLPGKNLSLTTHNDPSHDLCRPFLIHLPAPPTLLFH